MIERKCKNCGKMFLAGTREVNRGGGVLCSRKCAALFKHKTKPQHGENNPNWRGGRSSNPYKSYVAKYKQQNTEKIKAHNLIATEIRAGRLLPKQCVVCGASKSEAHHEDYSKPYFITWLCRRCHRKEHLPQPA